MKKTFYCVRHGATLWNKERRFQGISDIPLSEEGIAQAEAMKPFYDGLSFDAVYSSPLERAVKTAEIITEGRGMKIHIEEGLIERSFGSFEGELMAGIDINGLHLLRPGEAGETLEENAERFRNCLLDIMKKDPNDSFLIVTHGGCIGNLIRILYREENEGKTLPRGLLPNGSVTVFTYDEEGFHVDKIGYTGE